MKEGITKQSKVNLALFEIKKKEFFSYFTEIELHQILREASILNFKKGEKFFLNNKGEQIVYLLTEGVIRVNKCSFNGEAMSSFFLGKNEFLPFSLSLNKHLEDFSMEACTDLTIVSMPQKKYQNIVNNNREVSDFLHYKTGRIITDLMQNSYINSLPHPRLRVILTLIYMAKKFGEKCNSDDYSIPNWLTQVKIAKIAGTTRETVGKTYKMLKNEELLTQSLRKIELTSAFFEKFKEYF